jgi:hypothetical protein
MNYFLKEVTTTYDLRKFIKFPNELYRNHPYFVPALDADELTTLHWDKNPAFAHCEARYWLAYHGKNIVGRIAAIINPKHTQKWNQSYMRFGWFDTINDINVSKLLISSVENWAAEKNMTAIHGPLGFSDLDHEGMLIEGYDQLGTLATIYNYPYYPEHLNHLGFKKDVDWKEYRITVPSQLDPKITRASEIVLTRNHLTMPIIKNKRELMTYASQVFELINREYSHLYGAVPLSEGEIDHYIQAYFGFIHPDFVPFLLNENQKVVAFGVTIPSLSTALQKCQGSLFPLGWVHLLRALRKNDLADLYLIAVDKKYQGLGLNLPIMVRIWKVFNERGITQVESNPELDSNANVQSLWKTFERHQHKRRRCYIKYLDK